MRLLLLFIAFTCLLNVQAQRFVRVSIKTSEDLNETTIAVNPQNQSEIVAASNIDAFFYSQDSGANWELINPTSKLGIYGDPVLHYANGQLFYAHLSKTKGKEWGEWFDRIVVQKVNSISPWEEESFSIGFNEPKMQDKPWLSSDELSAKYRGRLYVSWTEFDKYDSDLEEHKSRIRFSAYHPETNSFTEAITISDSTGDCVDSDNTLEGAVTAVGRNGEIYAVWAGHDKIFFDKSIDGGLSWGKDKVIGKQVNGWDMDMPHIMRANGMPFLSYDHFNHILYVCWADERDGTADIWLKYSFDGGDNWSNAIKINQNGEYSHEYFPNMIFNPKSKKVQICYFDQQYSTTGKFFGISLATFSANNPDELTNIDVSGIPHSLPGERFFFGDYIDLDANDRYNYLVYAGYSHANSYINILSIEEGWTADAPNVNYSGVNVLADKDSLFLSFNSDLECKLKGKVSVFQNGMKTKQKFKFQANSSSYVETILTATPLIEEQPVFVKVKYKKKELRTGKKRKESYITYLP